MKHNILLHLDKKPSRKLYGNYSTAGSTNEVQTMVKSVAEVVSISYQADVLSTSKVSNTPIKKIALPIVSVKVRITDGNRWLNTYALLDSGSTNSFCSKSIMQQLAVKGKDVNLQLTTLEGMKRKARTNVIQLVVCAVDGSNEVTLPMVYTRDDLHLKGSNIAQYDEVKSYEHLKDIIMPDVD